MEIKPENCGTTRAIQATYKACVTNKEPYKQFDE